MKTFLKTNLYMSLLLVCLVLLACEPTTDDDPDGTTGAAELPELADLVGRWGIFETIDGQGNATTSAPCRHSLEIHTSGDFLYVNAAQGDWLEGNVQFNSADSTVRLSGNGEVVSFKLLSVTDQGFELRAETSEGGTVSINTQRFTLLEGEDCTSFTPESLTTKWSIGAFSHALYEGETLLDERAVEDIKANQYSLEFKADGEVLLIDLVNQFNYEQGVFRMLDNHNLIIDFDFDDDDPGSLVHLEGVQWPYWIFERVGFETDGTTGQEIRIVTQYQMTANSGDEPAFNQEELPGQWQITEVEVLHSQATGGDNEGPVPGMLFQFDTSGTGQVSMQGQVVSRLEYEMLDLSNLLVSFDEGEHDSSAGEANGFSIFHVSAHEGDQVELIIYEPSRGEHEDEMGGAMFRVVTKKQ